MAVLLVNSDTLDKDSPIVYFFFIVAMLGLYDITSEIVDANLQLFSKNSYKKICFFAAVYLKEKSIFTSSIISIIVFLLFPKVFFGPPTHPRLRNGQAAEINAN